MTNMIFKDKFDQAENSPLNNIYLITEYVNIEKRKNTFEKKEDNLNISPKTLVGKTLSDYRDLHKYEISPTAKKNLQTNSKLALLDNISNNSKSTNINFLAYSNQISSNLDNLVLYKPKNSKNIKRVTFRDQMKISLNKTNSNLKNIRLPLVDIIEVESYKKYNLPLELNNTKTDKTKNIFKNTLKHLTCQSINNPCCIVF